jgi:hypothetical protein
MNKTLAGIVIVAGITTVGTVANLGQPVNPNYTDNGTALVTYIQGNEVDISKSSPIVTFSKWNKEQLTVQFATTTTTSEAVGTGTEVDNSIGNGEKVEMAPTADGQGFNVDINLASKPNTNIFSYTFSGTSDMDFFYQAPLWQDAGLSAPTAQCSDTDCIYPDGRHNQRPVNVVGSYAVYSKTHSNHLLGSTNYETGKLFHIYRPQVTDANGSTTWASLSYSNNTLNITVPQSFLDSAVYPVLVDPTFGYTTAGASRDGNYTISNVDSAAGYTASTGDTVVSFSIYGGSDGGPPGTGTVDLAVYTWNGSHPVTRLSTPTTVNLVGSFGSPVWSTSNSVSVSLTGGTTYVLARGNDNPPNNTYLWFDSVGNWDADQFSNVPLPSTWSSIGTGTNNEDSFYATYTKAVTVSNNNSGSLIKGAGALIKGSASINN